MSHPSLKQNQQNSPDYQRELYLAEQEKIRKEHKQRQLENSDTRKRKALSVQMSKPSLIDAVLKVKYSK